MLIEFEKIKPENIRCLKVLENKGIPLDFCSEIMIEAHKLQEPLLAVIYLNDILNDLEDIDQIYHNIINQAVNLNLLIDFNFAGCSNDQIEFFVSKFFTDQRIIKYIPSVIQVVSDAILYNINKTIITEKEEYQKFLEMIIEKNKTTIESIEIFLDSMPLYMLTCIPGFIEANSAEDSTKYTNEDITAAIVDILKKNNIEIIDNIDFVCRNVISLFYNQQFLVNYYTHKEINPLKQKYLLHQFTEYMYAGQNLFTHFSNPYNYIYHTLNKIADDESTKRNFLFLANYK